MSKFFTVLMLVAAAFMLTQVDLVPKARETSIAATLAPGNEVVMYSLTTCGYCRALRGKMTQAGIPFTEHFVDADPARMQEFSAVLMAQNVPPGAVGVPTLTVNGTLLPNNPPFEIIKQNLKYK